MKPSTPASHHVSIPDKAVLSSRLLCGPGPSNVHPDVLEAMSHPIVGHLDPAFLSVLDEINDMLRVVFGTANRLTFPISGTGSAGMEAAFVNLVEAGDTAVVCVNGVFGERMCEVARRCGAHVVRVDADWGRPVDPDAVADTVGSHPEARVVAVVHAETSTGVESDVPAVAAATHEAAPDAFVVVDAVTSLAGIPVAVDDWAVDVCYAGTQKCLSVPPGLAPITFTERAVAHVVERTTPVQSWYLDIGLLANYLDASARVYHHTAPVSALLGLHEGLRRVLDEGLEERVARHRSAGSRLQAVLPDRGYGLFAADGHRLPQLTTVRLPEGIDDGEVRRRLLMERGIEIGGGLGVWAGRLWRIGLMGENATEDVVDRVLAALPH